MYEYFAFVDESTAKRYRLCIFSLPEKDAAKFREEFESLRLSGQRQIHMSKESDRRRKQVLDTLLRNSSWRALIVQSAHGARVDIQTRQQLFMVASMHPTWKKIKHLVVERSTHNYRDAKTLSWIRENTNNRFDYVFSNPKDQSGLWAADAIAWAYAKNGHWRAMVLHRVTVLTSP